MTTQEQKEESRDRFTHWAFGVMSALVTAGVIGVFSMSTSLSRLDERVANLTKTITERVDYAVQRIDKITQEQRDSDRRIGALEGRSRNN